MFETLLFLPFHQIFEQGVSSRAKKTAIRFKDLTLTFQEVNSRANQLAHYLIKLMEGKGCTFEEEVRIGIFLEPSPDIFISILAIMKSGAAFVPLDPALPRERLARYINSSQLKFIITQNCWLSDPLFNQAQIEADRIISINQRCLEIALYEETNPSINIKPHEFVNRLAYIIFTSGSTGIPKGVAIEHKGLPDCMETAIQTMQAHDNDIIAQLAPLSADAILWQMMLAFGSGACLDIVPQEIRNCPKALCDYYLQHKITIGILTPTILNQFQPEEFDKSSIRVWLTNGERLSEILVKRWSNKQWKLKNGYGPSEVTIATSVGDCIPGEEPHVGKPGKGLEIFILDDNLRPVDKGAAGELVIAGRGVARGYWGDEFADKTKERFLKIMHPTDNSKGIINVFKTGDIAKLSKEDNIVIIGRKDRQIKVFGVLACPEEIEALILKVAPEVAGVFVDTRIDRNGYPQFIAYLVPRQFGQPLNLHKIYHALVGKLSPYMIPAVWAVTYQNYLTTNGKIDGAKLHKITLAQDFNAAASDAQFTVYRLISDVAIFSDYQPIQLIEQNLSSIWHQVLDMPEDKKLCSLDNFYVLGGNSIRFTLILQKAEKVFNKNFANIPSVEFNLNPTLGGLARWLYRYMNPGSPLTKKREGDPRKPHIYFIHDVTGNVQYANLLAAVDPSFPFYCIDAINYRGIIGPGATIEEIAYYYKQAIKIEQPAGIIVLYAWSGGGVIAREMSRQFSEEGREVYTHVNDSISPQFTQAMQEENRIKELLLLADNLSWIMNNIKHAITSSQLINKDYEQQICSIFEQLSTSVISDSSDRLAQVSREEYLQWLNTARVITVAQVNYHPRSPFPQCRVIASEATVQRINNRTLGWSDIKEQNVLIVAGDHFAAIKHENVFADFNKHLRMLNEQLRKSQEVINREFSKEEVNAINKQLRNYYTENLLRREYPQNFEQINSEPFFELQISDGKLDTVNFEKFIESFDQDNILSKPKRLLIQGPPKVGKTRQLITFIKNWAAGKVCNGKVDWIFYIRLEQLPRYISNGMTSIADIIYSECFDYQGSGEEIRQLINQQLNNNPSNILYIFDNGYEFLQSLKRYPEQHLLQLDILLQKFFKATNYIVAGPGENFYEITRYCQFNAHLAITGLTQAGMKQYIDWHFNTIKKPSLTETLLDFLSENVVASSIAYVPIYLKMLCKVWERHSTEQQASINLLSNTEFTQFIVDGLFDKHFGPEPSVDKTRFLAYLGKLAFEKLKSHKQVVDKSLLDSIKSDELFLDSEQLFKQGVQSGLIEISSHSDLFRGISYQFAYRDLEEFFVAAYFAYAINLAQGGNLIDIIKYIKSNKFLMSLELLSFVAGFLKNSPEGLQIFFDTLLDGPIDILGIYHNLLLIRCFAECGFSDLVKQKNSLLTNLLRFAEIWFKGEKNIQIIMSFESLLKQYPIVYQYLEPFFIKKIIFYCISLRQGNSVKNLEQDVLYIMYFLSGVPYRTENIITPLLSVLAEEKFPDVIKEYALLLVGKIAAVDKKIMVLLDKISVESTLVSQCIEAYMELAKRNLDAVIRHLRESFSASSNVSYKIISAYLLCSLDKESQPYFNYFSEVISSSKIPTISRLAALSFLGRLYDRLPEAVIKILKKAKNDKNKDITFAAVMKLFHCTPVNNDLIQRLVYAIDSVEKVQRAMGEVTQIKQTDPDLFIPLLHSKHDGLIIIALSFFERCSKVDDKVAANIKQCVLEDYSSAIKVYAIKVCLNTLKISKSTLINKFIHILETVLAPVKTKETKETRELACALLMSMERESEILISSLFELAALGGGEDNFAFQPLIELAKRKPDFVIPELIKLIPDSNQGSRKRLVAARLLGRIGIAREDILSELNLLTLDFNPTIYLHAIEALYLLKENITKFIPYLINLVKSQDENIALLAATILRWLARDYDFWANFTDNDAINDYHLAIILYDVPYENIISIASGDNKTCLLSAVVINAIKNHAPLCLSSATKRLIGNNLPNALRKFIDTGFEALAPVNTNVIENISDSLLSEIFTKKYELINTSYTLFCAAIEEEFIKIKPKKILLNAETYYITAFKTVLHKGSRRELDSDVCNEVEKFVAQELTSVFDGETFYVTKTSTDSVAPTIEHDSTTNNKPELPQIGSPIINALNKYRTITLQQPEKMPNRNIANYVKIEVTYDSNSITGEQTGIQLHM